MSFSSDKKSLTELNVSNQTDLENSIQNDQDSLASVHHTEDLSRSLSPRVINLITIAGVIGTGLFLGTGKMLSKGGPLSLLLNYIIIGVLLVLNMCLCLGEMSSLYPTSGSFTTYAKRFGSESLGFAVLSNYWFNDACSVAADLTALQLVFEYWDTKSMPWWGISLIFWFLLLAMNLVSVRVYAECEYILAMLKVISIIIFFIISIICNAGVNPNHEYIGFKYWSIGDAPFVNGLRGFCSCLSTAAFAMGGLESVSITGGETKNPSVTIPKTIKASMTRILVFYIFTGFFIGMNVPYNYPNLSTKSTATSPFTIVFQQVGARGAGGFMNAVILTSIISAGNHALYAGSRLAFNLSSQNYIPKIFAFQNRYKVPYVAVLFTWFISGLCFASAFVGSGTLFDWLQSIVGLSNLISWWVIGVISLRFRSGLKAQNREHELIYKNWTYPVGPWIVVIFGGFIILIQGWSVFSPFVVTDFFQNYLELIVFPVCFIGWWLYKRDRFVKAEDMDLDTDRYIQTQEEKDEEAYAKSLTGWAKFKYNFVDNFL